MVHVPRCRLPLLLALALATGCGSTSSEPGGPEPVFRFSFVVIADPHLFGAAEAEARLQVAADWIAAHAADETIELVFVVGDLGSRRDRVLAVLDPLPAPWVPVLGDNAIQGGQEAAFDADLASHHAALAGVLDGWSKPPVPVANPDTGGESYFQNASFDHEDVHFVVLDWCTRTIGGLPGEQADLHALPSGTWPWFQDDLAACPKTRLENVVLISHHPMHDLLGGAGAFSPDEMGFLEAFTKLYADHVYADFAGHYHFNWHDGVNDGGFEVFVTDATHEDDVTLRVVRVLDDGTRLAYEHDLVVVPF